VTLADTGSSVDPLAPLGAVLVLSVGAVLVLRRHALIR
jgi:LPXTG-motif cell wall-anchored protein